MILDLFKNPIQRNDKIRTICDETNANEAYKGELLVADMIAQATLDAREVVLRMRELIVPFCRRFRCARYDGSKIVVETKR